LSPAKLIGLGVAALGVLNFIWGFLPAVSTSASDLRDANLSVFAVGPAYVPILLLIAGLLAFGALLPGSDRSRLAVAAVAVGGAIGAIVALGTPGLIEIASSTQISKGLGLILLVVFGIVQAVLAIVGYVVGSDAMASASAPAGSATGIRTASGSFRNPGYGQRPAAQNASAATGFAEPGGGGYAMAPAGVPGPPQGSSPASAYDPAARFDAPTYGAPGQVPPGPDPTYNPRDAETWRAGGVGGQQSWYGSESGSGSFGPGRSMPGTEQPPTASGQPVASPYQFAPAGHVDSSGKPPTDGVTPDETPTGPQAVVRPSTRDDVPVASQPSPDQHVETRIDDADPNSSVTAAAEPRAAVSDPPAQAADRTSPDDQHHSLLDGAQTEGIGEGDAQSDAAPGAAATGQAAVDLSSAATAVYRRPSATPGSEERTQ
jgi:uncharacterized membrane protein